MGTGSSCLPKCTGRGSIRTNEDYANQRSRYEPLKTGRRDRASDRGGRRRRTPEEGRGGRREGRRPGEEDPEPPAGSGGPVAPSSRERRGDPSGRANGEIQPGSPSSRANGEIQPGSPSRDSGEIQPGSPSSRDSGEIQRASPRQGRGRARNSLNRVTQTPGVRNQTQMAGPSTSHERTRRSESESNYQASVTPRTGVHSLPSTAFDDPSSPANPKHNINRSAPRGSASLPPRHPHSPTTARTTSVVARQQAEASSTNSRPPNLTQRRSSEREDTSIPGSSALSSRTPRHGQSATPHGQVEAQPQAQAPQRAEARPRPPAPARSQARSQAHQHPEAPRRPPRPAPAPAHQDLEAQRQPPRSAPAQAHQHSEIQPQPPAPAQAQAQQHPEAPRQPPQIQASSLIQRLAPGEPQVPTNAAPAHPHEEISGPLEDLDGSAFQHHQRHLHQAQLPRSSDLDEVLQWVHVPQTEVGPSET